LDPKVGFVVVSEDCKELSPLIVVEFEAGHIQDHEFAPPLLGYWVLQVNFGVRDALCFSVFFDEFHENIYYEDKQSPCGVKLKPCDHCSKAREVITADLFLEHIYKISSS